MLKKLIILFILLISVSSYATDRYVDAVNIDGTFSNEALNCSTPSDNDYDITTRQCGSGSSLVYSTIQAAITASSVGDEIIMRNGTFTEHDILIDPSTKSGTAWTTGNYTTLRSYPGEWAKIDGNNASTIAVIKCYDGYGVQDSANILSYWLFERFEVTGGHNGFWLKRGPMWFRYLYIHDNVADSGGDEPTGGLVINIAQQNIIEYCYFKDNRDTNSSYSNPSNIIFGADYRDSDDNGGNGLAFDDTLCINRNIVRYNYITGSKIGFHHKNQQRFGYNNRNPNGMTAYDDWGDDIHHNIVLGATNKSILVGQDFVQVHHNITDFSIHSSQLGDVPINYKAVIYNNTVITTDNAFAMNAGETFSGNTMLNYYDDSPNKTVHPHIWYYNNISDGTGSTGDAPYPYVIAWDMPANEGSNYTDDWSDLVITKNLIHDADLTDVFRIGHKYDGYTGCDYQDLTTAEVNACGATWTGEAFTNYENDTADLFLGTSGANQYITDGTFIVSGSITIADGGLNASHPYILGVTIPSYIGATNPSDNDWVAGVLAMDASYFTSQTNGSDPTWLEGAEADTTAPILSETTPVPTPSTDTTPTVVINTDEAGTVSCGGDCSCSGSVTVGNNNVDLGTLSVGVHSNCTVTVTDASENASDPLSLTSFEITASTVSVSGLSFSGAIKN